MTTVCEPCVAVNTSTISAEDYAVALLDEAAEPAHRRQRFTVAN